VAGNYDMYQRMAATADEPSTAHRQGAGELSPGGRKGRDDSSQVRQSGTRRRRRFPYRKVADLEEEIFERETAVEQLHHRLSLGETQRNADRVRQIQAEIAEHQESLQTLYKHWDEATELNW